MGPFHRHHSRNFYMRILAPCLDFLGTIIEPLVVGWTPSKIVKTVVPIWCRIVFRFEWVYILGSNFAFLRKYLQKTIFFQFLTVFAKSSQKYCVFSHDIFAETAICGDILHFANFARNASDGHIISTRNVPKPILGCVAGPDLRYRACFGRFCEIFVPS